MKLIKILWSIVVFTSCFAVTVIASEVKDSLVVHVFGAYDDDTTYLEGASIQWLGDGIGTATGSNGVARIPAMEVLPAQFVVRYVGFVPDTIYVANSHRRHYYVFLVNELMLDAVEIVRERRSQLVSILNPVKMEILLDTELKRAACCDLSESFETNASVDVSYSDAVTGAKEIRLLGLDGVYVEMLQENVPTLRGLAIPFGLTYVPGPWMRSICISKGTGTVRSGHESMTGAINFTYAMPLETEPLSMDLFANHHGRYEANLISGMNISDRLGSVLAFNAGGMHHKFDGNDDRFMDMPLYIKYTVMNRWRYTSPLVNSQLFVQYLYEDRMSGQMNFDPALHKGTDWVYGLGMKTKRLQAYGKSAFFLKGHPKSNVGLIYSMNSHRLNSYFGTRAYDADQVGYNITAMFQTGFGDRHGLVGGINHYMDRVEESFEWIYIDDRIWDVGGFLEYTFTHQEKISLVAAARMDHHSLHGWQASPRFHMRYSPDERTAIRMSFGRGFRSARLLPENLSLMASSREFTYSELPRFESSWSAGWSLYREIPLGSRQGHISVDYYYTKFTDQLVVDVNQGDNTVRFYDLEGSSFAHSAQVEVSAAIQAGLEFRLAYKIDEVKVTLEEGLVTRPFSYRHKGLLVVSYSSDNDLWQADMNMDLNGKQSLPRSFSGQDQRSFSPVYVLLNIQFTRFIGKHTELYFGAENLTNYRQNDPVVGANAPFGDRFDTSQVWGPVTGILGYAGLRVRLLARQ